jgi:hypothetical protein
MNPGSFLRQRGVDATPHHGRFRPQFILRLSRVISSSLQHQLSPAPFTLFAFNQVSTMHGTTEHGDECQTVVFGSIKHWERGVR